ncbi:MAG: hypothetical protein AAF799_29980 [Myxococcota bacterium]
MSGRVLNLLHRYYTTTRPNPRVLELCGATEPDTPYTAERDEDLTVILNGWARPEYLPLVWEGIQYQTRRPAQTWIVQNGPGKLAAVPREFFASVREHHTRIIDSDLNLGCWFRFILAALYCRTRYVAIFDDDTLPGCEALAAALTDLHARPGIYGGRGIIYVDEGGPPRFWAHEVAGWPAGTPEATRVDFVGHAWVMETAWLRRMLPLLPSTFLDAAEPGRQCGEDMFLSFAGQKLGVPTFVWGHGATCNARWSSLQALEMGCHENSISMSGGLAGGDEHLRELLAAGWRLLRFQ